MITADYVQIFLVFVCRSGVEGGSGASGAAAQCGGERGLASPLFGFS